MVPEIAYAEGLIHCNECRLLFFGPVLKELQKQFRAVVMPSLSLNAAAMVFDGAESDAQPCAGMFGSCRTHRLSWPFAAVPGRLGTVFASFG
ncbi:MAG: hypothetical protein E5Y73_08560 [Mesorhizobium sp.]|uniref:hypothetical protein n=1 Tax=Mesorhizobium sp. TaxID=1871066 RepID=UPI00120792E4|nr:hypothetical protein [Mesorhizobium sp.]TIL95174.1 MAG: hypothetical protein E5Y73_08560 [Mesorhizobium sp.]